MEFNLSENEIQRYSRHILLRELGGTGQARLKSARVLVVGAGGLGSPLALYLAAAGVGTIGLVDADVVELSNLQRQIAHDVANLGRAKVASGAEALARDQPAGGGGDSTRPGWTPTNVAELIGGYDIVCDGTDNFATRFLLADACVAARKDAGSAPPCCASRASSPPSSRTKAARATAAFTPSHRRTGSCRTCSEAGVLGAVTGVMGTLQATEVLKEITRHRRVAVRLAADLGRAGRGIPHRSS